ncbi:hypothetical protein ACQJBY_031939 [Aegilops geniculata]
MAGLQRLAAPARDVQTDLLLARSVLQVLFSEHGELKRLDELGASFCGGRIRSVLDLHSGSGRCPYKPEALVQHQGDAPPARGHRRLQVLLLDIFSSVLSVGVLACLHHLTVACFEQNGQLKFQYAIKLGSSFFHMVILLCSILCKLCKMNPLVFFIYHGNLSSLKHGNCSL